MCLIDASGTRTVAYFLLFGRAQRHVYVSWSVYRAGLFMFYSISGKWEWESLVATIGPFSSFSNSDLGPIISV